MIRFDLATSQGSRDKKLNAKGKKSTMKRLHKQLQPNTAVAAADEDDHNGESMPFKRAKIVPQIGAETTNAT